MGWGAALLAGAGGAAKGIVGQQRFDQAEELKRELERQRAEVRELLAKVSDETKRRGQDMTDAQKAADRAGKDADRTAKADQARANLERLWSKDTDTSAQGWDRNRIAETGQQQTGALGWDRNRISEDLGWGRIGATERGQDVGATTARRGQDLGASTAIRGQDVGAATAAAGQAGTAQRSKARNVLDVLRLKQRGDASLAGDQTDFANEFDRLYSDPNAMGGEAARAIAAPAGPAPGAAAPAVAPTGAPLPVPVRPQSNAVPAADPRIALATQMLALTKQITAMPPGPARENTKRQLAALRAQAETLRTPPPGQD